MVPLSTPCNIVFIPAKDNRSKGEHTYYQRQTAEPQTFTLNQDQLNKLCYPLRDDLRFVESTSTLTEANYKAYLKDRKTAIANQFLKALYGE